MRLLIVITLCFSFSATAQRVKENVKQQVVLAAENQDSRINPAPAPVKKKVKKR